MVIVCSSRCCGYCSNPDVVYHGHAGLGVSECATRECTEDAGLGVTDLAKPEYMEEAGLGVRDLATREYNDEIGLLTGSDPLDAVSGVEEQAIPVLTEGGELLAGEDCVASATCGPSCCNTRAEEGSAVCGLCGLSW